MLQSRRRAISSKTPGSPAPESSTTSRPPTSGPATSRPITAVIGARLATHFSLGLTTTPSRTSRRASTRAQKSTGRPPPARNSWQWCSFCMLPLRRHRSSRPKSSRSWSARAPSTTANGPSTAAKSKAGSPERSSRPNLVARFSPAQRGRRAPCPSPEVGDLGRRKPRPSDHPGSGGAWGEGYPDGVQNTDFTTIAGPQSAGGALDCARPWQEVVAGRARFSPIEQPHLPVARGAREARNPELVGCWRGASTASLVGCVQLRCDRLR